MEPIAKLYGSRKWMVLTNYSLEIEGNTMSIKFSSSAGGKTTDAWDTTARNHNVPVSPSLSQGAITGPRSDQSISNDDLTDIFKTCLGSSGIQAAIRTVSSKVSDEEQRISAFQHISKSLAYGGDVHHACYVADHIPVKRARALSFLVICVECLRLNLLEEAIDIADKKIPSDDTSGGLFKAKAYHVISREFASCGKIAAAMAYALRVPDTWVALCNISFILERKGDRRRARTIFEAIPRNSQAEALSDFLSFDRTVSFLNSIFNEDEKGEILSRFSKDLTENGNIDEAVEVAMNISGKGLEVFESIAAIMVRNNEINRLSEIRDPTGREYIRREISKFQERLKINKIVTLPTIPED